MRPLDGLVTTRTGSRCSRVGPAVTTTLFPCHGARRNRSRSAAARIASGSVMRPGRSLGPSARGPVSGPTNCQPRAASVFRLVRVAGWAYIASFIAGAASTGPVRASNKAVSTSSARPIAARASRFADDELTALLRSEEHTSELQSRVDLVCRLLLEKIESVLHDAVRGHQREPHVL